MSGSKESRTFVRRDVFADFQNRRPQKLVPSISGLRKPWVSAVEKNQKFVGARMTRGRNHLWQTEWWETEVEKCPRKIQQSRFERRRLWTRSIGFFFSRTIRSFVRTREGRVSYARRDRWTAGGYDPGTVPSYRRECVCVCVCREEGGGHPRGTIYHTLLSLYNPYLAYFELLDIHPYPPPPTCRRKSVKLDGPQGKRRTRIRERAVCVFYLVKRSHTQRFPDLVRIRIFIPLRRIPVACWGREFIDGEEESRKNKII